MDDIYGSAASDARKAATADAFRRASTEAQRLGREAKSTLEDTVSRGRDIAEDVAEAAKEDLAEKSRKVAEKAREYMAEGKKRASRAAEHVSDYADENTAIVAVAAFGVGLLLGHLITKRR